MAVLKYYDTTTSKWEPLAVLSGNSDISDLKITDDYLHLVNKLGNKVGNGIDVADISGAAAKLQTKIVDALPTTDISATTIYLVKDLSSPDNQNEYNEYIYVNNNWERLDATADNTNVDSIGEIDINSLF